MTVPAVKPASITEPNVTLEGEEPDGRNRLLFLARQRSLDPAAPWLSAMKGTP